MKAIVITLLALGGLSAVLPVLSSSGGSISLPGNAGGTLTFSANDAPAQTTITVAPIPGPTPKWPLPEQIAGYVVTLNNAVTFTEFPAVMCITGAFSSDRAYWLVVSDSNGAAQPKITASVTAAGVCTSPVHSRGQMKAHESYTFVMMMSADKITPLPRAERAARPGGISTLQK